MGLEMVILADTGWRSWSEALSGVPSGTGRAPPPAPGNRLELASCISRGAPPFWVSGGVAREGRLSRSSLLLQETSKASNWALQIPSCSQPATRRRKLGVDKESVLCRAVLATTWRGPCVWSQLSFHCQSHFGPCCIAGMDEEVESMEGSRGRGRALQFAPITMTLSSIRRQTCFRISLPICWACATFKVCSLP